MRGKSKREKIRMKNLIKDIQTLNIIVFVSTLAIFSLGSVIIPKKNTSELEKRNLAKFLSYSVESFFSGDYFKGIEEFYNDTFPFREKFVNLASYIDEAKGIRQGKDEIKIYKVEK